MDSTPQERLSQIAKFSTLHPRPEGHKFAYGTAGFRLLGSLLDSVVFRVGLLAALRSRKLDGETIGVMITASHNPPDDNGVKLIDPQGEMLEASWETYATKLANAETDDELTKDYLAVAEALKINLDSPANVVFARDTRASGPALVAALKDGLQAVAADYTDYRILTTPQLHYVVKCINTATTATPYGKPTEEGYYEKLATAFQIVTMGKPKPPVITVDAANGVGGPKLKELARYIGSDHIDINVVKDEIDAVEKLNHQCGADFVKTQQKLPLGLEPASLELYASLDGDADRIVFYYVDEASKFHLLDGDKIASLVAMFIRDLLAVSGVDLQVGIVQTAYANGSSSKYLTDILKVPVTVTPTGVKHLHHAAQLFDIGIYFEANGHGTVLFSNSAMKSLESFEAQNPGQQDAVTTLLSLAALINQTVGDALSDLLLVTAILSHKVWGPDEWNLAYTDLPNRLVRVVVKDRMAFKTEDAERRLVEPKGLQAQIDALVKKYKSGRSFVRASGTEDAVRVYAEAATRLEADELAVKVSDLLKVL
ncbi:hypothetical protein POJ06DRAFT_115284 [Lipomyces tetrasporus]|uniref:Phosphoacetylglucosamine mutase n=1 Tax=Lipomyces tetrasporus TaxID=54092 RepID=A0AAD7QQV5_9ASCO|nr:uncharacterized protein POJ06DRAFT_115284 [Lipomyces tetrasporus]KAJ8099710.1 hypothetical protein POJ06DRAFT_115284 [Lipomyces tetrasporus]